MKILYVTTISLTINSFFKPHIDMLVREGHQVDIACNYKDLSFDGLYSELGCSFYQIDFSRSPLSSDNVRAYGQLKKVIENGDYDIVHCHTPNASVITRLVCRKYRKNKGVKVFYTAHGFHFYKGAPKLNWMIFYPIEKLCSRFTDKLITINKEDYELAKNKFSAKEVHYVPGVGIDLSRFKDVQVDRAAKRREIGVPEDAFLLLSVGELNDNKNHQIIIRTLAELDNNDIHYVIAGEGEKRDELIRLSQELGVSSQLHLIGYRTDIPEFNRAADIFCFPSVREGLGLAAVEALACGLPVVAAKNRGTSETVVQYENGFLCGYNDLQAFTDSIGRLISDRALYERIKNKSCDGAQRFSLENILKDMKKIYTEV